jgi:hypothetical protein
MKAAIRAGALFLCVACDASSQEDEAGLAHELESIVHKIEAIDEGRADASKETVAWLMEIVSSDDLKYHKPFVVSHGRGGTSYDPASTYAILALSSIINDAPFTYSDPDWEIGANMTGERKRWLEWWDEHGANFSLRMAGESSDATAADVESEKDRQAENFRTHLEISRLQATAHAQGNFQDYFELEREVLFDELDDPAETVDFLKVQGDETSSEIFKKNPSLPHSKSADIEPRNSAPRENELPSYTLWGFIGVMIVAAIGLLLLLLKGRN